MAANFESESGAGQEGSASRRIGRVYAEALLDAAEQRNEADAVGEELSSLLGALNAVPEVLQLLGSPIVKRSNKESIIQKTFSGSASELVYNFLAVLNRHDRLDILPHAIHAYGELRDKRGRRVRVLVRSAVPLDEGQTHELRNALGSALELEPIVENRVDPDLLGGMIVQVGDDVFDGSVRTRIDTLRNQLLARGSHEIQVGRDRFRHS